MTKKTITLTSMLQEMQTWIQIPAATIQAADKSNITTSNSKELKYYVNSWTKGHYDEDPQLLVNSLIHLIPHVCFRNSYTSTCRR